MLSNKTSTFVSHFFTYGDILNLFPYDWDRRNYRLAWSKSKRYEVYFVIALLLYTFDTSYGIAVLVHIITYQPEDIDPNMKLKIMLHVLTRLGALILNYIMLLMSNSNMNFYNQLFVTNAECHRKYEAEMLLADNRFLNPVPMLVFALFANSFGPVINYLSDFDSIHYWSFQILGLGHFICRIPFILLEFYISAMAIFGLGFYILMGLLHVKAMSTSLKMLRMQLLQRKTTSSKQLSLFKVYRTLLTITFNEACFHLTAYGTGAMFICHVMLNAVIVKLYNRFPLFNVLIFVFASGGAILFEQVWVVNRGENIQRLRSINKTTQLLK